MTDFAPLAAELRQRVRGFFQARGEPLEGGAGENTLATNSDLVPRRADPLLGMLRADAGFDSIVGRSLVDIGCGFGALSVYFAHLGAEVVGLDPNAARLTVGAGICSERNLPARFEAAAMQELPLPDASRDLALMNNSLCYVTADSDRGAALREAQRVLRPGGYLLIRNPNRFALLDPFTSLPLLGALPGEWPGRVAAMLGRRRSAVRLVSVGAACRELRRAQFTSVSDLAVPGKTRPALARRVASYQHLLARKSDE